MANTVKSAYKISNSLSDTLWEIIKYWNVFSKTIIGNHFMTSLDSITVNLAKMTKAEDPGRKQQFLEEVNNNITEAFIWNDKARRRKLMSKEEYQLLYVQLFKLHTLLNTANQRKFRS